MVERPSSDYYEILQLSSAADPETIERVFRHLAKRYHPDNNVSGDARRFNEVREAYEVLSDPEARAAYDARYEQDRADRWQIFRQDTAETDRDDDQRLFHALLSLLYIARRNDPDKAGLAPSHLERTLGTPREHLAFPLWYLRKRGFVEVQENGLLAITVDGIDKLASDDMAIPERRLLTEHSMGEPPEDGPAAADAPANRPASEDAPADEGATGDAPGGAVPDWDSPDT